MSRGRRSHRGHDEEEHENHERWLISYADMITLLMVFFIVLFSMSVIDASKYRAVAESFMEAVGGGPVESPPVATTENPTAPIPDPNAPTTEDEPERTKDEIAKDLQTQIEQAGLEKDVKVVTDERGVVLLLTNSLLFDEGRAQILAAGRSVLTRLSPMLTRQNKPLVIEGHTDSRPISTSQFPSNWELSTTRATQVLRFLLGTGVEPGQLTAAGYADTHPRASNATAIGQSENRRVEIILVVKPASARPGVASRSGGDSSLPSSGGATLPGSGSAGTADLPAGTTGQ